VDIILIEPEFDDELMFGTSILDYSARLEIAKHGSSPVTLKLARDYERYKVVSPSARHRDLRAPRSPRAGSGRARARAAVGVAAGAGADDRGAGFATTAGKKPTRKPAS